MEKKFNVVCAALVAVIAVFVPMLGAPSVAKAETEVDTVSIPVLIKGWYETDVSFPLTEIDAQSWIQLRATVEVPGDIDPYLIDVGAWYPNRTCGEGTWFNNTSRTGSIARPADWMLVNRNSGGQYTFSSIDGAATEYLNFNMVGDAYGVDMTLPMGDCGSTPTPTPTPTSTVTIDPADAYEFLPGPECSVVEIRALSDVGVEARGPHGFYADLPEAGHYAYIPALTTADTEVAVRVSVAGGPYEDVSAPVVPCDPATPTPTVTATPTQKPTVTSSPTAKPTPPEFVRTAPYTLPGYHTVNGRQWFTECEPYSQTERCRTDIWATQVSYENGKFVKRNGWVFNNLTYLPFMKRGQWADNPLGYTGSWRAADGRQWRTECDTDKTGRNGCRSYAIARVIEQTGSGYRVVNKSVLNNIVLFN